MSLIFCKECGKEMSDKADKCPNCGCPTREVNQSDAIGKKRREKSIIGLIGFVISFFGFIFSIADFVLVGVIAIIVAIVSLSKKERKKWMAISAIVISVVGFALSPSDSSKQNSKEIDSNKAESSSQTKSASIEERKENKNVNNDVEEEKDDNIINFSNKNVSISYTGFELTTDYNEEDCIIIYYDYTNNSGDSGSAMLNSYIKVFQDGVSCDSTMLPFDVEIEAVNNHSKEIQSGHTISVADVFKISSDSDLTIEASEAFSFSDKKDTMILKIK